MSYYLNYKSNIRKGISSYVLFFIFCIFVNSQLFANDTKEKHADIIAIDEVIEIVNDKYVKDVPLEKMIDGALLGLIRSIDQYSDYMSPDDLKDFQSSISGIVYGIGIEFGRRDGVFTIVSVFPNSPAQSVGILPGDVILEINDKSCENLSITRVANEIRGKDGTVKVKIGRRDNDGKISFLTVNPKRAKLSSNSVKTILFDENIIFIKISSFNKNTYNSIISEIKKHKNKKYFHDIKGLIIDLRDNPGGLLDQSVDISNAFLPENSPIVTMHTKNSNNIASYVSNSSKDIISGKPIVILINENTSSAAEILSSALQENNRAVTVGSTSYGKGSVQDTFKLMSLPGSAIKLTFASYKTPMGREMEGNGVKPDLYIADNGSEVSLDSSLSLQKQSPIKEAIEILQEESKYKDLMSTENHPYNNKIYSDEENLKASTGLEASSAVNLGRNENDFLMEDKSNTNGVTSFRGSLSSDKLDKKEKTLYSYNRPNNSLYIV